MRNHLNVMLITAIGLSACSLITPGPGNPPVTAVHADAGLADEDADGIADLADNCPEIRNANQADFDGDGTGNVCDECPTDPLRITATAQNPCATIMEEDAGHPIPDAGNPRDAGRDAGIPDASLADSGAEVPDAGEATDSGLPMQDAGQPDAGVPQTGLRVTHIGPPSMSIPSGTSGVVVMSLLIENRLDEQVRFTGITANRTGILAASSVIGFMVRERNTVQHGTLVTFGEGLATLGFPSNPIVVDPGFDATVDLVIALSSAVSSGTVQLRIREASWLVFTNASGTPVLPEGEFPMVGNTMNVVSGTGALGTVSVESQNVLGGTQDMPILVYPGYANVSVAEFRLCEMTGNESAVIDAVTVRNNGSAQLTDFSNFRIMDGSTDLGYALIVPYGFHFRPSVVLEVGQCKSFTLRADIAESAEPGRTFNFTINNFWDVQAHGSITGAGVAVYAGGSDTFPVGDTDPGSNWARVAGTITEDGGSLTSNLVVSNADGVVPDRVLPGGGTLIAAFDLREFVTDIEVQQLGFVVLDGSGNPLGTGDHTLAGVLIAETDSGTAFSISATSSDVYGGTCTISSGIVSGTCGGPQGTSAWSLSTLFTVAGGSTKRLIFRAGMNQYATQNDSYSVMLTYVKARQVNNGVTVTYFPNVRSQPGVQVVESPTLTVIKSPGFNPVNAVRGGTLQKIGSFDLINGEYEPIRVNAVKIRVCAKSTTITSVIDCELSNQSEIAAVTNVTLMVGGVQIAPSQNITTTLGGTFSTQYEFGENITGTINVHAVVSSMYSSANLAVSLTVVSATGTYTQNNISLAEVLGQSLYISSGGALAIQSLGNDGVTNLDKLVHAGEVDIPLFKFKVKETTSSEAMTLRKIHFAVQNAANTLQNFRLMDESTGMFHGVAVNPNILVGSHGEIQFNGLTVPFARGGERNFIVKATAVPASGMATNNQDVKLVVTFVEYTGDVSGTTTRVSGGMVVGQSTSDTAGVSLFVPGGDFLQVWDTARYEVGDLVSFDMMNNGTFTSPYAIKSVGNNTITLSQTLLPDGPTLDILGSVYAGARLTAHPFTSRNTQVQEIEPTIVGLNVGEDVQASENVIGVFVIRNEGERSMRIRELQFEITGSYDFTQGYGPRNFKLDRADPITGNRIANTLNAGSSLSPPRYNANSENVSSVVPVQSGTVLEWNLDQAGITEEIGAGSSKAYVVIADTTSIKNNNVSGSTATTQVRMLGSKGSPTMGSNDGLLWSYTRTSTGADSGILTISDSYIVSGKSILYQ